MSKAFIFLVKSILGNFYIHLAIFSGHTASDTQANPSTIVCESQLIWIEHKYFCLRPKDLVITWVVLVLNTSLIWVCTSGLKLAADLGPVLALFYKYIVPPNLPNSNREKGTVWKRRKIKFVFVQSWRFLSKRTLLFFNFVHVNWIIFTSIKTV